MALYFRHPFPSRAGFSAYRMPGLAVHGPLILAATLVGVALFGEHPALRPLIGIWVLAGVYLGRDIAVRCHYYPVLTLVAWAVSALVLLRPATMAALGQAGVWTAVGATIAVGFVLLWTARALTRDDI